MNRVIEKSDRRGVVSRGSSTCSIVKSRRTSVIEDGMMGRGQLTAPRGG